MLQRSDGPVYLISDDARITALRAADLSNATITAPELTLTIANGYVSRHGSNSAAPNDAALSSYDQWTVQGKFDAHRPLYRIALSDIGGTVLYI